MNNLNFVCEFLNNNYYDCFIILYKNSNTKKTIKDIEAILKGEHSIKRLLIDQYLLSGDTNNRFISVEVVNNKLNLLTIKNVGGSDYFKEKTDKYIKNSYYKY